MLFLGESMLSLHFQFRIGHATICNFVPEVCEAIYEELKEDYLQVFKILKFDIL